ncbi:MAG: hypothetical protein ACLR8P_02410 [Clostridium fessum]
MSPEVEEVSLDGPELPELLWLPELPLELLLSSLEESSDESVLESELPESGVRWSWWLFFSSFGGAVLKSSQPLSNSLEAAVWRL